MKLISLTQGLFAQVDDEDFDRLNQFKWYAAKYKNTFYAQRQVRLLKGGPQTCIKMHCVILQDTYIDHVDGNGLNNQKYNLRLATSSQNSMNRKKKNNCSSSYKGVHWVADRNKWLARIYVNKKKVFLGYFSLEIDAAKAYDRAARCHFGEFAKTNFED